MAPETPVSLLREDSQKVIKELEKPSKFIGPFLVRTANECLEEAHSQPIPEQLFGDFWFEYEFCVLFADTNIGKSILAVQIGNHISRGIPISADVFGVGCKPQKVAYFDFEMSDKQFENRYSENYTNLYRFSDNFLRVCIDFMNMPSDVSKEDYILEGVESFVLSTGTSILIIDNITWLSADLEKSKNAADLLKGFKRLKEKYGLSILILAHTPKRDAKTPITRNDLRGSGTLMDFADSSFAIGASCQGPERRYIKQIKVRATSKDFGGENVCVCDIEKPTNELRLSFVERSDERAHLKTLSDKELAEVDQRIIECKGSNPKFSARKIATELGISHTKVNNVLRKHKDQYGANMPF